MTTADFNSYLGHYPSKYELVSTTHKAILEEANAAIVSGDYEGFLAHCSDDTVWTFAGDTTLRGKEAVRQYMAKVYTEPPKFRVENLIEQGDFVVALGTISLRNPEGVLVAYDYCDVWRFQDGQMAELKAFVIEHQAKEA